MRPGSKTRGCGPVWAEAITAASAKKRRAVEDGFMAGLWKLIAGRALVNGIVGNLLEAEG